MKVSSDSSLSTTLRIKNAAHRVFLEKGYASATIREIAEEAGTNVALMNYHFGSKKELYTVVMQEKIQQLFDSVLPIFSNEDTSLDQKIEQMVSSYTDFLFENPTLPTFILNEMRKNNFEAIMARQLERVPETYIISQIRNAVGNLNPLHILLSVVGMIVFPFMACPGLQHAGIMDDNEFRKMMTERKILIPRWVKSMLGDAQTTTDT